MIFSEKFVTNSVEKRFLAFRIENEKLFEYLESLGIKFSNTEHGVFTEKMIVTLPSGQSTPIDNLNNYPFACEFTTISQWLIGMLLWEVGDPSHKKWNEFSDFTKELLEILTKKPSHWYGKGKLENYSREDLDWALSWYGDYYEEELVPRDFVIDMSDRAIIIHAYKVKESLSSCEEIDVLIGEKMSVCDGGRLTRTFRINGDDDLWNDYDEEITAYRDSNRTYYTFMNKIISSAEEKGFATYDKDTWGCDDPNEKWTILSGWERLTPEREIEEDFLDRLSFDDDITEISKTLISTNEMLRKILIVHGKEGNIEAGDIEQINLAKNIDFKEMVLDNYVVFDDYELFNGYDGNHCRLNITRNHPYQLEFQLICPRNLWMLEGYEQRPLEMACIVAEHVTGIDYYNWSYDEKNKLRFMATEFQTDMEKDLAIFTLVMSSENFEGENYGFISLKDYKKQYKTILETAFGNAENRALLLGCDLDKCSELDVLDLIAEGTINLNPSTDYSLKKGQAAKIDLFISYSERSVNISCNIIGDPEQRTMKDGTDRLSLLAERIKAATSSLEGLSLYNDSEEDSINCKKIELELRPHLE